MFPEFASVSTSQATAKIAHSSDTAVPPEEYAVSVTWQKDACERARPLPAPLLDPGPLPDLLPVSRQERRCTTMSLVKRHPLITFFVLAYALTWIIQSPLVFLRDSITDAQGQILYILSANVVSVVAIVLTAIVFGRGALRKLLGRLLIWRVNPFWYLVVVLGPVALAGGVVGLNTLMGGPALSLGMPLLGAAFFSCLLRCPRQCAGRGDRVARVRPAPSASQKERPERQPHPRTDLGIVAPTAVVDGSTWPNSHPLRRFRGLGHRSERDPHLGV